MSFDTSNPFTNAKVVAADVDPEDYHRCDIPRGDVNFPISSSVLGLIAPCPKRFIDGYESPDSKAKQTGNLWDTLLLAPAHFEKRYVVCPETYKSQGMKCPSCESVTDSKSCRACKCDRVPVTAEKPWDWASSVCKEWREANKGREPVKSELADDAKKAADVVLSKPMLAEMLATAQKQVMVVGEYHDPGTGLVIPVRALLDIVPAKDGKWGKWLYDYKTCRSASTKAKRSDVYKFGYARQAAFHSALYVAATGEDRCVFGHITQESIAPFHVEPDLLSQRYVDIGRRHFMFALALYCKCLKTGNWEGYYAEERLEGHRLIQPDDWMELVGEERMLQTSEPEDVGPSDAEVEEKAEFVPF